MNDMTTYTARFNTFEGGETHGIDHQTRLRLAKCGFYYRGSGKSVACFKCRRNFDEWDRVHEVIDEHKERSPDCCRGIQEAGENDKGIVYIHSNIRVFLTQLYSDNIFHI